MRYGYSIFCVMIALAVVCAAASAGAQGTYGHTNGYLNGHSNGCTSGYANGYPSFAWDTRSIWAAPACFAPEYGSRGLGCCPYPRPTCCDNIWAGYCQEPRGCGHSYRRCMPVVCAPCTTVVPSCGPSVVEGGVQQQTTVQSAEAISPSPSPSPAPKPTDDAAQTKKETTPAGK